MSAEALAAPILILGAPRSGTTWLAKIIDSHPDVLYRHEPDKLVPSPSHLTADDVPGLVARWAADRSPRSASKLPFFRKSWQPVWAPGVKTVVAAVVGVAGRLPAPLNGLSRVPIPDFATRPPPRFAFKSISWAGGAAIFAHALPDSRTIFILRHPCGHVASMMRGHREQRFDLTEQGSNMPFNEKAALRFSGGFGIAEAAFHALPDASKYAWNWRAFNEPVYAAVASEPNVHVVLYEALCAEPAALSRRLLNFAGLDRNRQTEAFVARSTSYRGASGYYAILRDAVASAEAWRTTMLPEDQAAVRSVVSASPLARFWPDLMNAASGAADHPLGDTAHSVSHRPT